MRFSVNLCFFLAFLFVLTDACCKKGGTVSPLMDSKLLGTWRVDSLASIHGGDEKTALMDTVYNPGYKNMHIAILFKEDFTIYCSNYSYDIRGTFSLKNNTMLQINVAEQLDFVLRPNSDFQPLFVKSVNDADSYRIEGSGGLGSKLLIYYSNTQSIIYLTKI
ncbi:MAG: hypothetical protein ABI378_13245 [Chitinophagaceae bacterium]